MRMNKSKKSRKTRKNRNKRHRKTFRGGTTTPFSDVGNIFSNFSNSVQNMFSTFTVTPSGFNPPDNPDITKQFLNPTSQSVNQMYKSAF